MAVCVPEGLPSIESPTGLKWLRWGANYSDSRTQSERLYATILKSPVVDAQDIDQIGKDLPRTFALDAIFSDEQRLQLDQLLMAVAQYQGCYVQSMNFICGMVLVQMRDLDEVTNSDIFWLCITIFREILPGYHDKVLLGTQMALRVLDDLFKTLYPEEQP